MESQPCEPSYPSSLINQQADLVFQLPHSPAFAALANEELPEFITPIYIDPHNSYVNISWEAIFTSLVAFTYFKCLLL